MTCEIIKISKQRSKFGGDVYLVCFKSLTGKSYISYIAPKFRNFARWKKVLDVGVILSGLKLSKKKPNLIDADSRFVVVENKGE